jgi:putative nucleotidyltransferase with HDIG domain
MAAEMSKQQIDKMLEMLADLPSLPAVATKVLQVASSEDATAADITRLISVDQGLASKILGTCNSAFYGLPQRVKTLSQAVALLGFKAVRNLVLVQSLPWKRAEQKSFADEAIWVHGAAVATTSRVLAGQTGRCDPEEALLAGLMHDTGRLALNQLLKEKFEPVMNAIYNREEDSITVERELVGIDHTVFGEKVLEKWSFPDEMVRVARDHHQPAGQLDGLTLIVRAADELAWLMGKGVREPEQPPTEVPPALSILGVSLGDLDALEERVAAALEQARDLFGV